MITKIQYFFISVEEMNWIAVKKNNYLEPLNFTIYYLN